MNEILSDLSYFRSVVQALEEPIKDNQYVSGKDPQRRSSVTLEEARLLAALSAGKRVLEFGTGLGISTHAMASMAELVVTIDPDEWVKANVTTADNVVKLQSLSDAKGYAPFDVAFIDGQHNLQSVLVDIVGAVWMLKPCGVIAFHDLSQDEVRAAVESISHIFVRTGTFNTCGQLTMGVLS